jgi:hypothetical protein
MAYRLIITAYNPAFTPEFKTWIKKNITPSMVNAEPHDNHASYFLNTIMSNTEVINLEDALLITELQSQNVEYVEF